MAEAKKRNNHGVTKDMCQMITCEFRVSYPHLFKAQSMDGKNPKYSITMLFPKDQEITGTTLGGGDTTLKRILMNAKKQAYGSKENWPENLETCVKDGDSPEHKDKEGYKGHWVIKATSKEDSKPGLVDEDAMPITEQANFYPGCYARAYLLAYTWTFGKKDGVGLIVEHVQKTKDDKSFGGKVAIEKVFKPVGSRNRKPVDDELEDEESF